jgi:UDP-N-acetylglucosamine enolpyruvyl transferase
MYDSEADRATALEVKAPMKLKGGIVTGQDVRGTMSLVIAAAISTQSSVIHGIDQLARGYEYLPRRLESLNIQTRLNASV